MVYSLSTLLMLKKAACRYKPFQGITIWIVDALRLMDIGLLYNEGEDWLAPESQVIFIGAVFSGLVVSLLLWYSKYKLHYDDALRMIADIEGEYSRKTFQPQVLKTT